MGASVSHAALKRAMYSASVQLWFDVHEIGLPFVMNISRCRFLINEVGAFVWTAVLALRIH